uniref:SIN3-HDAC complex-associated factor n=1 Tax=Myxine glutinosa TaxID=7769 RepID=UPI00358F6AB8
MFGFHRPKVYRSPQGCCICKAKSSSSRFTDSRRYEAEFESCFGLVESRSGEICNACVLLVKRWKKLPAGSDRTWNHVVDARAGPGIKTTLRPKKLKSNFSPRNIGLRRVKDNLKKQSSDTCSTASSTSPSRSPSYSAHSDDSSDTEVGGGTREPSMSFLDPTYWKRKEVCCGIVYKGRYGEVVINPRLFKPCCVSTKSTATVEQRPSAEPPPQQQESEQKWQWEMPPHVGH